MEDFSRQKETGPGGMIAKGGLFQVRSLSLGMGGVCWVDDLTVLTR